MMKLKSKKGFTLAELLIVIAIIAIMVAIAIPVFNGQLNKAKAGTDLANLRSAYAVAQIEMLTNKPASGTADKDALQAAINEALPDVTSQLGSGGIVVGDSPVNSEGVVDKSKITIGGKTLSELEALAQ